MKWIVLLATGVLSLGIGIMVGKTMVSDSADKQRADQQSGQTDKRPRSATRSRMNSGRDAGMVGRVGGRPPQGFENRVRHMQELSKKVQFGRGMPDFDALFGIWETAREMSAADLQQALFELDESGVNQREGMFVKAMLVMQLAKKDGPVAMDYAKSMNSSRFFPAKEMALRSWAGEDPKAAYAWYEANKSDLNPRENRNFLASALAGLAREDFDSAFAKAKNVDAMSQKDVLEQLGAVAVLDAAKREEFAKYVMTLEDDDMVEEIGENMAKRLVQEDVQQAIAFVEGWQGEDKSELIEEVAKQWAYTEPEKALAWRLDKPNAQRDVGDMFGNWARRDSNAARAWLAGQGDVDGLNKDQLRDSAVRRVMWNDDYPQAAKWADSITDEGERNSSYRSIYRRWSRLDKAGANQWAAGLDDSAREAIMPNERTNEPADVIVPSP